MKKTGTTRKIRVFIVDDHPIVRRGFQFVVTMEPEFNVFGEAENGPVGPGKNSGV